MPSPVITDTIDAYQHTKNPKHGTGGVENLPRPIDVRSLYWTLMGAEAGKSMGAPAWSADPITLLTKVLVEGRGDAGTNEYNVNNKQARAMYAQVNDVLTSFGSDISAHNAAIYPAAALDKSQTAARLGIPVERAWNGTGKSKATGKTGAQHASKFDAAMAAGVATAPKNAQILDYVTRGLTGQLLPQEHLAGRIDELETAGATTGGLVGKQLLNYIKAQIPAADANAQKAASMLSAKYLNTTARNMYRSAAGIPEAMPMEPYNMRTPTATQRTESEIAASLPAIQSILQQLIGTAPNAPTQR